MIALSALRHCLDGAVPAAIATCSSEGVPNVSYVSEVHYVDPRHVALSYQFFNKTRANVLANPLARALVIDPGTGAQYELELRYLRTETSGALFESMRVKLAGIAAHTGMASVFRLLGADVYEVLGIEAVTAGDQPAIAASPLPELRRLSERLVQCADLESLIDVLLEGLESELSIGHAMLFLHDPAGRRVFLLGSRGYEESGIGSEIPLGHGIVGIAAAERTPVRLTHRAEEFRYGRSMSEGADPTTLIPLPGLPAPGSQLAVPMAAAGRLLGVLFVESETDGDFDYELEDVLVTIANQLAAILHELTDEPGRGRSEPVARPPAASAPAPLRVRYFPETSSVFVDDDYLIKGVAGAIFWRLVSDYQESGRSQFSNRELRLDPSLGLPELGENLEARLVLLKRRLQEKCHDVRLVPVARGKFRVEVARAPEVTREGSRGRDPSS